MAFLDTSGLLCLADAGEDGHAQAVAVARQMRQAITQSYVLSEFVALAHSRRFDRKLALRFLEGLRRDPSIEIVHVDEELYDAAISLLRRRLDKSWSLCDAVSFVLMEHRNVSEALTTDHHFEQAGFIKLLSA